jgi:hypothetical protein
LGSSLGRIKASTESVDFGMVEAEKILGRAEGDQTARLEKSYARA